MAPRGILRHRTPEPFDHRIETNSTATPSMTSRVSSKAPLSGYSDAGSFVAPREEITARERLDFLTYEATLSNVRRRIARSTGIDSDLLRGVCVHAQLKMYRECGYDDRMLAHAAEREEEEAGRLRKTLGERERGKFKGGLARVIADVLKMRTAELLRMSTSEFHRMAVRAVGVSRRNRQGRTHK